MTRLATPVPCAFERMCGTTMYDSTEGKALRAGPHVFYTCNACAERTHAVVREGAKQLANVANTYAKKYPEIRPLLALVRETFQSQRTT